MQKRGIVFLALFFSSIITAEPQPPLSHTLLAMMDGNEVGIEQIHALIHVIKEILKRQVGVRSAHSTERVGPYALRGTLHSITSLVTVEHAAIKEKDVATLDELQGMLDEVKKDFMVFMRPFLIEIYEMPRHVTHSLMREWADLHNRHDSLIFEWSRYKRLGDEEVFHHKVQTFNELNQFCSDLRSFLDDLIKSLPKSYQQYIEFVQQKSPTP